MLLNLIRYTALHYTLPDFYIYLIFVHFISIFFSCYLFIVFLTCILLNCSQKNQNIFWLLEYKSLKRSLPCSYFIAKWIVSRSFIFLMPDVLDNCLNVWRHRLTHYEVSFIFKYIYYSFHCVCFKKQYFFNKIFFICGRENFIEIQ